MSPAWRELAKTLGLYVLLLVCVASWVLPQRSLDHRRTRWDEQESLLFLPSGQYLEAVSLGFQAVMADALYVWSIQYYGHHRSALGRKYLWRIFDVITDLDPFYQDAYLTGSLIMAVDMADTGLAIQLLEKGAAKNPDDWIYPLEAGYYAWINDEDYERAAAYFDRALERPGVPLTVRRARAGMDEYAGNTEQALTLWIEIYDDAVARRDERIEAIAWQHVYDLKVDMDMETLETAIRRFRLDRTVPPRVLEALATQGYLGEVPRTPDGEPYSYDPVTGRLGDPREGASRSDR